MSKNANARLDAAEAMQRAESSSIVDADRLARRGEQGTDITRVDIATILPSKLQPRIRFEGIEQLAESILKAGGVLQPLLVRRRNDDPSTLELIDGERRLRAVHALLDSRRIDEHSVPVRILDVPSDAVASVLALLANAERKRLSAFEVAQSYQHLKRALEDAGEPASSRDMEQYVVHQHASIAAYVRVAEVLNDTLIQNAGVTTAAGSPDRDRVNRLGIAALKRVANAPEHERVQALQQACAQSERRTSRAPSPDAPPRTFEERVRDMAGREQGIIRWRGPTHDVPVRDALRLLHQELLPAAVAIGRRALVVSDAPGLVVEAHDGSTVIMCPGSVETLSATDAVRALELLDALRRRIKRSARPRAK